MADSRLFDSRIMALEIPDRADHSDVALDLSRNELVHPDLDDLVRSVVATSSPATVTRYPSYQSLRSTVAGTLGCSPESIELFPGSDDAITTVLWALGRRQRMLLLQEPNYPGYTRAAALSGLRVSAWAPRPWGFRFVVDDAVRGMQNKPRGMTVVTDPHGIFGRGFAEEELAALAGAARVYGHVLVVDECYHAFAPGDSHRVLEPGDSDVVFIGSLSKAFGLAGARLGYVRAEPTVIRYLRRWRRPGAIAGGTIHVAERLLREHADDLARIRDEVVAGRDHLSGRLETAVPEWNVLPSCTNFLTIDTSRETAAARVAAQLASDGIRVRTHARTPGIGALLQVTCAPVPTMDQVVPRLVAAASAEAAAVPTS